MWTRVSAPPVEEWQVTPVTHNGRIRYGLTKGFARRVDSDTHAPIHYRSLNRARRVRDRLRRRDERTRDAEARIDHCKG